MTPNPDTSSKDKIKYICPVTLVPFNGVNSFVVIWSSGYVLTERSIRELGIESLQSEYGPFTEGDIIHLLPSEEELILRRARLQAELVVAQRKSKKKKRNEDLLVEQSNSVINQQVETHTPKKICTSSSLSTHQVVGSAQSKNQSHEERSQVYQNLFHKDADKKVSQRDLFISVGGLRYTLS